MTRRSGSWIPKSIILSSCHLVILSSCHSPAICRELHLDPSAIGGGGVLSAGFGMAWSGSGRSDGGGGGIPGASITGPLWPTGPGSQSQTPCVWWQPTMVPTRPKASRIVNGRRIGFLTFRQECPGGHPTPVLPRHPNPRRIQSTRRCSHAKVVGPTLVSAPMVHTLHRVG
jgi:hypothetical protein